jgi:hypothetical protein
MELPASPFQGLFSCWRSSQDLRSGLIYIAASRLKISSLEEAKQQSPGRKPHKR